MAFVQAPVEGHRQPHPIHLVERQPERADGPFQDRGVGNIEIEAGRSQGAPGLARFDDALFGQVDIDPAGKAVFLIPGGFAVAQQN